MLIQPKSKNRKRVGSNTLMAIRRKIESISQREQVSMSFVITVALAEALDIPLNEDYDYAKINQRKSRTPASRTSGKNRGNSVRSLNV